MSWNWNWLTRIFSGTVKTLLAGVAANKLEDANKKIDEIDHVDDDTKAVLKAILAELVAEIVDEVNKAV